MQDPPGGGTALQHVETAYALTYALTYAGPAWRRHSAAACRGGEYALAYERTADPL